MYRLGHINFHTAIFGAAIVAVVVGNRLALAAAVSADARCAHTAARCTTTAAAAAISGTEAHSRTEWYSWPPVKMFGVGRPRAERIEPSVPPRIGVRTGVTPSRSIASRAAGSS